jgi:hypothetical protein
MGVTLRRRAHHRGQDLADDLERQLVATSRFWTVGQPSHAALLESSPNTTYRELRQSQATGDLDACYTVRREQDHPHALGVALPQIPTCGQLLKLASLLIPHRNGHGPTHTPFDPTTAEGCLYIANVTLDYGWVTASLAAPPVATSLFTLPAAEAVYL